MNIILLAAGTSSRMGKTNKLLISVNGCALVAYSAMQALKYLASLNERSRLVVVTGYRHASTQKALEPCKLFIGKTNAPLDMITVVNRNYKQGQFSSLKTGIKETLPDSPFFVSLADLPEITASNYKLLADNLSLFDAVRPVVMNNPGHPVLIAERIKEKFLQEPDTSSASGVLKKCKVNEIYFNDSTWITDIDTPEDIAQLHLS